MDRDARQGFVASCVVHEAQQTRGWRSRLPVFSHDAEEIELCLGLGRQTSSDLSCFGRILPRDNELFKELLHEAGVAQGPDGFLPRRKKPSLARFSTTLGAFAELIQVR